MRALRLAPVVVAALLAAGHARADGMPDAPVSASAARMDWSGVYIGGQAGWGWSNTGWTFPVDSYFTIPAGKLSYDTNPSGGFMGGHLTINRQVGRFVYGAELALNGTFIEDTRTGPFTALFPGDVFDTYIKQYGTLTGRFGYARDAWLAYASAGYAGAHASLLAVSGPPGGGVIGNINQYLNGWTVGAGIEYMLLPRLSLGLQYDFIRLYGAQSATLTYGTPSTDPFIIKSHDVDMHTVSARFSIKLDRPDPEISSLK